MTEPSKSRVVLITGVSSGIGRATASRFAERDFRVFGTTRTPATTPALPGVVLLKLDVGDDAAVRAAVERVVAEAGRIDVLINNAGYALAGAVEETSDSEMKDLFETNVFGVARMIRATLPIMREQGGGRIVNVGSILGVMPAPFLGFYSAAKHALEGLSESLDHEVRPFGIRVVLIEPSYTRTELTRNSKTVATAAGEYAVARGRASTAFADNTAAGIDPALVAGVILRAATAAAPRLRYPAGRPAKLLATLRRFAPSRVFDRGVRRNFGLDAQATPPARLPAE